MDLSVVENEVDPKECSKSIRKMLILSKRTKSVFLSYDDGVDFSFGA